MRITVFWEPRLGLPLSGEATIIGRQSMAEIKNCLLLQAIRLYHRDPY